MPADVWTRLDAHLAEWWARVEQERAERWNRIDAGAARLCARVAGMDPKDQEKRDERNEER